MTYNLLNGLRSDEVVRTILDKYDFFIFPVTNPDGMSCEQLVMREATLTRYG